jgi:hypothetical protein
MYRNVCFTLNNPVDADREHLKGNAVFKYIIYGEEVGESGTPHLQGYCELAKRTRWEALKKLFPTAHLERREGTASEAATYCKKDGKFIEEGTMSNPGKRNDLVAIYAMARDGKADTDIGEAHPAAYLRYYKAIDRVKFNHDSEDNSFSPIEVLVLWGEAGTGKTRRAHEIDPNLFSLDHSGQIWFDGYHGQETLLLDDFYGSIKYESLLRLLDGYKYALPIKGGHTWKKWKRVIITSNTPPEHWYDRGLTDALKRRIHGIQKVGALVLPPTSGTKRLLEQESVVTKRARQI